MHETHEVEFIRTRVVVALFVVMSGAACSGALPEPSRTMRLRTVCPGGPEYYIPTDAVDARSISQEHWRSEYVGLLEAARARSISCESRDGDVYRFTFLPSFDPAVVFTLTRSGGWILSSTTLRRATDQKPWRIEGAHAGSVSEAAATKVLKALDDADFWSADTWRESTADDGTVRIFEARQGSSYQLVIRHVPTEEPLRAAGRAFFELASLPVPRQAR